MPHPAHSALGRVDRLRRQLLSPPVTLRRERPHEVACIPGAVANTTKRTVPAAISRKFKGGLLYVPFTFLTDSFVRGLEAGAELNFEGYTFNARTGCYSRCLNVLSRSGERDMILEHWLEASERFLSLVKEQTPPDEYRSWRTHIEYVRHNGVGRLWPQYLG
jgi:hypothetical protein